MKKFFIAALLALCSACALIGCDDEAPAPAPAPHVHTYAAEWTKGEEYHWKRATCEHTDEVSEKGLHVYGEDAICDVCGYERVAEHTHTYQSDWSKDEREHWKKATCEHEVEEARGEHIYGDDLLCDVCGYERQSTEEHTHTFATEWSSNYTYHWYAATCGCAGVYSEVTEHTGNPCTVCNYEQYTIVYYSKLSDTTCQVTRLYDTAAVDVVIPAKLSNGLIVKGIASDAFKGNTQIRSVKIQEGVEYIGQTAFSGCTSLEKITLAKSLKSVAWHAFYNTKYYNDTNNWTGDCLYIDDCLITVNQTATGSLQVKEGTRLLADSAIYNTQITELTLPDSVQIIDEGALEGNKKLTTVHLGAGVTEIAKLNFQGCNALKSLSLPASLQACEARSFSGGGLTSIAMQGNGEFYKVEKNCLIDKRTNTLVYAAAGGATSFTLPSVAHIAENAFYDYYEVETLVLPDGLQTIGKSAFEDCALTALSIPDSVTTIGDRAFAACTSLKTVYLGKGVSSLSGTAFSDCAALTSFTVSLQNEVVEVVNGIVVDWNAKSTVWADPALKAANIPEGVETVSVRLFSEHQNVVSVYIPDSVKTLSYRAFYKCPSLESVVIGSGVETVTGQGQLFRECEKLKTVEIKSGVKALGDWSFYGCIALQSIVIPDSVQTLGQQIFDGCTSLRTASVGSGVAEIDYKAFYGCTSLSSLTIKGGSCIGMYAFKGCTQLKEVVLPNGVERIVHGAFEDCTGLTEITFTKSVTEIENTAFFNCTALAKVHYDGTEEEWSAIKIGPENTPLLNARKNG